MAKLMSVLSAHHSYCSVQSVSCDLCLPCTEGLAHWSYNESAAGYSEKGWLSRPRECDASGHISVSVDDCQRSTCQEALTGRWFDSSSPIGLTCSRWTHPSSLARVSPSRVHTYQPNGYIYILFSFVLPFSERGEAVLVVSSRYISTDRAAQHSSTRLRQANSRLNLRHILVSWLSDSTEWLSCRSCLLYSFSWFLSVVNCSRPLLIWLNYWRQKSA